MRIEPPPISVRLRKDTRRNPRRTAALRPLLLLVAVVWTVSNCKTRAGTTQVAGDTELRIAQKFKNNYTTVNNSSGTHVLLTEPIEAAAIETHNIPFMVMRLADSVIVHEGSYFRGYVKWVNDSTIEKLNIPGKMKPDQDLSSFTTRLKINSTYAAPKQ